MKFQCSTVLFLAPFAVNGDPYFQKSGLQADADTENTSVANDGNLRGRPAGQRRELFLADFFAILFGGGEVDNEECTEKSVLLLGRDIANPAFGFFEGETPGDRTIYKLPAYEPEAWLADGTETVLGYTVKNYVNTPLFPEDPFECLGGELWTFFDSQTNEFQGQIRDEFTCQGGPSVITGGTENYACAEGFVEVVEDTGAFEDENGYIIYKIVNCGKCDKDFK